MADSPDTRPPPRRSEWRMLAYGVIAGVVVIALLVAAFAIGQNRGETTTRAELAEAPPAEMPAAAEPTPAPAETEEAAAALFSQACGACHTFGAAGTTATIGPNLDTLAPSEEQVLAAIANGGSGTGQMPPNLLQGADAEQVAEFVAQAARP